MDNAQTSKKYILLLSIVLLIIFHQITDAANWSFAPEIGRGEIEIKPQFSLDGNGESVKNTTLSLVSGHHFANNAVIEVSFTLASSDNFFQAFDGYRLHAINASVGYRFKLSENFYIFPSVGISDWELKAKEGKFLNPGDEDEYRYNGSDSFGQLNLEFAINERFDIYLSYLRFNLKPGKFQSTEVGFRFLL